MGSRFEVWGFWVHPRSCQNRGDAGATSMRRSDRTAGATLVVARQTGRHKTGPYEKI